MECKFITPLLPTDFGILIKIYPEWNVNLNSNLLPTSIIVIKIYPEWNVNEELG